MSKRSEEAASAAYPENGSDNWIARPFFQEGYEQAEKELALTWEDIQAIDNIIVDMAQNTDWPLGGQEVFYEEVLRRFREMKDK